MKKSIKVKCSIGLLVAVLLLSACGSAETAGTTAASTEVQSLETTIESETSKGEESTSSKAETTAKEPVSLEEETTEKETIEESQTEEKASAESTAAEETTADSQQGSGKSVDSIYQEIVQSVELNSPMVLPDDFIVNYYGIDVNTLDEYVFSMSEVSTSAETIAILKAKNSADTANLSTSLQMVLDQKRAEMENYLPDQFQIVDKSSVQVSGNYVYLVISEQAAAITSIIEAGIQ